MERGNRIIIIDADERSFNYISGLLAPERYRAERITPDTSCGNSREFMMKNAEVIESAAAVLTELDLGEKVDGIELIKELTSAFISVPVIVVTSRNDPSYAAFAIESGAFDYIRKPVDGTELIARIKNALKYYNKSGIFSRSSGRGGKTDVAEAGVLTVDISSYVITNKGRDFMLPPKETEMLYYLASNPGKTFSRGELLRKVWSYDYLGETRTVDVHIRRIRAKLYDPENDWSIDTVWGVGYRFTLKKSETHQR